MHNHVRPLLNMLAVPELFGKKPDGVAGLVSLPAFARNGVGSIFRELLARSQFALRLPKAEPGAPARPDALVLSANPHSDSVTIEGVWERNGRFETGLVAVLTNRTALSVTFAPQRIGGLIPSWTRESCAQDVFAISVQGPAREESAPAASARAASARAASLRVDTRECPEGRNAVSGFSIAHGEKGTSVAGAFASNVDVRGQSGIRASLGPRQGVLLRAGVQEIPEGNRVAADAAVLSAADFAVPANDILSRFGVGQVLMRHVASRFRAQRGDTASTAYWVCSAPVIGSLLSRLYSPIDALCNGNGETAWSAGAVEQLLSALRDARGHAFGPTVEALDALVRLVEVRNAIYLSAGRETSYKTPPDDGYGGADTLRGTTEPPAFDTLDRPQGTVSALRTFAVLPEVSFQGSEGAVRGFLETAKDQLLREARARSRPGTPSNH